MYLLFENNIKTRNGFDRTIAPNASFDNGQIPLLPKRMAFLHNKAFADQVTRCITVEIRCQTDKAVEISLKRHASHHSSQMVARYVISPTSRKEQAVLVV